MTIPIIRNMRFTNVIFGYAIAGILFAAVNPATAQPTTTWISGEAGYMGQETASLSLRSPVSQNASGYTTQISLLYLGDYWSHEASVAFRKQYNVSMQPSGTASVADRFLTLNLVYKFLHYPLRNIADLPIDMGAGPYLFVQNQTTDYETGSRNPVDLNTLLYGGGLNLALRYQQPEVPVQAQFSVVNGGFFGSDEVNKLTDTYRESNANGWISEITARIDYRLLPDWKFFVKAGWIQQVEYHSGLTERTTFRHINSGLSFRLEDD